MKTTNLPPTPSSQKKSVIVRPPIINKNIHNNKPNPTNKIPLIILAVLIVLGGLGFGGYQLYKYVKNEKKSSLTVTANNVRELMKSNGWEFCGQIAPDCVYNEPDGDGYLRINEPTHRYEMFDLFIRGSELAITRPNTDKIDLYHYGPYDEHREASTWINYYLIVGDYNVRGKSMQTDKIITRNYNAKALTEAGALYANIPTSYVIYLTD